MNRLADETSPYLLQHADNPVDWYPWGEEALAKARAENKPILLSIGYSACHWCHVMAHESFENPDIAALMNRHFVNIKVDREERPDLDRIYQLAHQLITRRPGGWPLTMFLHPADQRPFFGGTYFPDQPRHGMPAFPDLLEKIAEYYATHQDEIRQTGQALVEALERLDRGDTPTGGQAEVLLVAGRDALLGQFDREHGGFGGAPKFPQAPVLERLLRHWRRTAHGSEPDTEALFAVALTLTRMAEGGIYDQLGGGFFRYAVDRYWRIPHFEKMLYDNGQLLALYAQAWLVSGDELYRAVATETADWLLRDMHAPEEGFYAALDADSDGKEGRFYLWTPDQARKLLDSEEYAVFAARYGLDEAPNFEGRWHLHQARSLSAAAEAAGVSESAARRLLASARSKLLAARDARNWPLRDEKQLVSWDALAIRGLAIAGRALQRPELIQAASDALDFIREQLIVDGRLLACYKDGRARLPAYLDDHAFLLDATLELLQAHWDDARLDFASWLAEQLLQRFMDTERGGFYFTAHDHEALIHRPRPMADDALPSGNAVAALALRRLGHLLGETRYIESSDRTLAAARGLLEEFPHGHPGLLNALEESLDEPTIVVIRGEPAVTGEWLASVQAVYAPQRLAFAIPPAARLPAGLALREAAEGPVAYVCRGSRCEAPVHSLEELAAALSEAS
ncbi:MAG: thioredoxin domain-containing protein [Gammaproteobacteria bacterium]|nr:MAG: thioredoxin domain-containing protein [Gammaproteobacteria bacterium]